MRKHTIEVTKEDILQGARRDGLFCPVAIAARRSLGIPVAVSYTIMLWGEFGAVLPKKATDFIKCFDDRIPVSPLTFEIEEIPKWFLEQQK